jgi:nucleoside-diphosphate kinase
MNLITRRDDFMHERTLSIIKPDGVSRNLIGDIIKRLENEGLVIKAMKMINMSKDEAKGFYKVHEGKPFYESVTDFMSSGPCIVMILEGDDAIARYRKLMGATNYEEAEEGTIRREFATDIEKNVVHGSDSQGNAEIEINYFFSALEVMDR